MATISLLRTSPSIWKQSFSIRSPSARLIPNNPSFYKAAKYDGTVKAKYFPKLCVKSFKETSSCMGLFEVHATSLTSSSEENSTYPFDVFGRAILKALEALKTPAVTMVWVGLLLMCDPYLAVAASGGWMGGSAFSFSSSSSSSSSPSSSSSSSSSFSSWSSSSYSSSCFPSYSSSSQPDKSRSNSSSNISLDWNWMSKLAIMLVAIMIIIVVVLDFSPESNSSPQISILKLQIGLLGSPCSLQSDLNQICQTADTSSVKGLRELLTETSVSLLRYPDYWISCYSSESVRHNSVSAEEYFNQLSIDERGKLDEETLVNVNNKKMESRTKKRNDGFNNEYIVVTILVAANRLHNLPKINGNRDLKEALKLLGSIHSSCIQAVEVIWTPQEENDTLTEVELLEKYPYLRPFNT